MLQATATLSRPGTVPTFFQSALELIGQLKEDWRVHQADWTQPGFRAIAVHRYGRWVRERSGRGLVRGPVRKVLSGLHRTLFRFVRNHYGIELHVETSIGRRVRIAHQSGIVISRYASIGDDCLIRQGVTLGAPSEKRWREAPKLGRGVEVGSGASILGSISIGDGAHIGAHALVMTNIPPGASVFVASPRVLQRQGRERLASGLRGDKTA